MFRSGMKGPDMGGIKGGLDSVKPPQQPATNFLSRTPRPAPTGGPIGPMRGPLPSGTGPLFRPSQPSFNLPGSGLAPRQPQMPRPQAPRRPNTEMLQQFSNIKSYMPESVQNAMQMPSSIGGNLPNQSAHSLLKPTPTGLGQDNQLGGPMTSVAGPLPNFLPKGAKSEFYEAFTPELLAKYGVNTPLRKSHFMGQMAHESGGFRHTSELGSKSYFNKYEPGTRVGKRLGNTNPGDGYKYRGRGMIQLTGKYNYEQMGKKLGLDLVNNPDLAEKPSVAAMIALEYWKDRGLNRAADQNNIRGITKKINGGYNGLKDRQRYQNKFLRIFK